MEQGHQARARRAAVAVGLLLCGAALAGCLEERPAYGPVHLAPMSRTFERDIPVPIGFVFVERGSEDASSGARRLYLRHTYTGDADKVSVRNFYREQMPLARWVKVNDSHVNGEYTLNYQKNAEWCTVRIRNQRGVGGVEVEVIITQQSEPAPGGRRQPA
jgi:hypothetical protein